ncbi:MAG: hypothetical protein JST42_23560 [Bacteroidetes bacterium]|nr:hypothetical protein [Bacteroidota bacterium]
MYLISDQQIDFILDDLEAGGIGTESLRYDLLDHICVIIEQNLEEGEDFEQFYRSAVRTFYREQLREIEQETALLLTLKNRLVLSRNRFFFLLFTLIGGPFIAYTVTGMISPSPTAGWNIPFHVWAPSFVYSIFPILILLVLYLTPDRLDPVIPWKSKVVIGFRPFIQVVSFP